MGCASSQTQQKLKPIDQYSPTHYTTKIDLNTKKVNQIGKNRPNGIPYEFETVKFEVSGRGEEQGQGYYLDEDGRMVEVELHSEDESDIGQSEYDTGGSKNQGSLNRLPNHVSKASPGVESAQQDIGIGVVEARRQEFVPLPERVEDKDSNENEVFDIQLLPEMKVLTLAEDGHMTIHPRH